MKAKELRIGNWVKYSNYADDSWEEITVGCGDLSFMCDVIREINDYYQPIPLTEEWLEKFGFEKITAWYRLGNHAVNPRVAFLYEFKNISIREIQYVHQLQNLYFALTGNELDTVS